MRSDPAFAQHNQQFWANVRKISELVGYTVGRGPTAQVRVPTLEAMLTALRSDGLATQHLVDDQWQVLPLAASLTDYFAHRAHVLNEYVAPRLMDSTRAAAVFAELTAHYQPRRPVLMNKQAGVKKQPMFLTGIVNTLIEAHLADLPCDYDPRRLTTFTTDGVPQWTLTRRFDGCFPACVNPIAVWEIKEYYYTTTFGSRIADGIYETMLDGLELAALRASTGITIDHVLVIDSQPVWWGQGKSYLCRLIDMLHMGYVSEVLFGYEVVERLPELARTWAAQYAERTKERTA